MINRILIFILLFICILYACKKDEDITPPEITVSSPSENSKFDVFETISVQATIIDNKNIDFVSIKMVDQNLVPVLPTITLEVEGKEYHLTHSYIIDDIHLSESIYYLQVKASDGVNEASQFVKLNIGEVPLARTGIILVSTPSGNNVKISVMDESNTISDRINIMADYAGSAVSSYYQYIGVLPYISGDFTAYDISNGSNLWTVSTPGYFEGLGFSEEVIYICYHSEQILGFNHSGGQVFSAYSYENWYPEKCFFHDNMLLVQEKFISSSTRKLSAYYKATGENSNKGFTMLFDIVATEDKDQDNVFLFVNEGGQGRILLMETNGQSYGYWEPHTLPNGMINDVVQIDGDNIIIAHSSSLLLYRYSNNSLTTFASYNAQSVVFDPIKSQVIAAVGNNVKFFNYPDGQLTENVSHDSFIQKIHLLYNK